MQPDRSEQSRIGSYLPSLSLALLAVGAAAALGTRLSDLRPVYFVYGLAFVLLGVFTLAPVRTQSGFVLGKHLWLLSCFGLLHGLVEWIDFWQAVYGNNPVLDVPRATVLLLSYVALFEFGRRLVQEATPAGEGLLAGWLSARLTFAALALLGVLTLGVGFAAGDAKPITIFNSLMRYLLCFPGSLLAARGLYLVGNRHVPGELSGGEQAMLRAASLLAWGGFAAYAIFGGLIVKATALPLDDWLNQEIFFAWTGVPVQVFRAVSAICVLLGVGHLMRVFKLLNALLLRRQELRYRQIVETTTDGYWMVSTEGCLLEVNQAYIDRSGYTREELLRMHIWDLEASHGEAGVRANIAWLMEAGHGLFESQHRAKNGEVWPVEVNASFLPDGGGNFYVFVRDITVRKQAAEELRKRGEELETYFNSALDLFCIADTEGYFRKVNGAWGTALGYTREELEGRRFMDLVHPDDVAATLEAMSQLSAQNPVLNFTNRYRCKDGSWRWIEWRSMPAGNLIYAAARDITQRKEAEETMRLARQLAEESARAKSEFLANMSHEIRTPLNAILGLTQIVLDGELSDEQRDYLGKVQHSSRLLLNILNDILDFSKIEAGHLHVEKTAFRLRETFREAMALYSSNAREKGLELHLDIEPDVPDAVIGDPYRLTQVLGNLLSNAVKFTECGEVRVMLECAGHDALGCELRVSVRDTGIGVSGEKINRLFHPFTQVDASNTRKFGGTGLGLVICKQLVELMGGQITVSSAAGQGSTFAFTVRLGVQAEAQNQASTPAPLSVESLRGRRILLAEDNYLNQIVARTFLGKLGLEVVVANHGGEAVDLVRKQPFDLVLMDLQMPEMDGFEATQKIRAMPQGKTLPIIAMTAAAMQHDKDACLAAGMNDHIAKPIEPEAVKAALLRWIQPV